MKVLFSIITLFLSLNFCIAQKLLNSWSQQNIENYTKEMYDEAQKLSPSELLEKNLNDQYWSEVFLTLNASVNNYSKDVNYLQSLTEQLTNKTETKLKGTSRLIIWDRISNGDIIFEGKGLIIDNDLFTVAGRANQILQNLTSKNFGNVSINSTEKELEILKINWKDYLKGKSVNGYEQEENKNAKIPEISNLAAIKALIISLQDNLSKEQITKNCLKKVYNLEEMPKDKGSSATYCNPDTYTNAYINILFGNKNNDDLKDAKWWLVFWNKNQNNLVWNSEKEIYEVKK
ncbi:hypothetical protein SAMN05443634_10264 [Chishuiella changwenlii]|uniref:Uncharacterized protein n=1 Tax=Chishuiella changwenlii TaxID=1434701 RepID=A0A1M6TRN8_9FLAO|nr:hypothetical protein [Chishuiella changwenlii]GGF04126.1 hypothetical protein GCM10010984_21810 [Chishuiella changwenlii]SHK59641.1 hypothetical protein SAMN05443634_10264 [Chishuiella changwenlii]